MLPARIPLPPGHIYAGPGPTGPTLHHPAPRAQPHTLASARPRAIAHELQSHTHSRLGRQISRGDSGIPLLRTVKRSPSPSAPKSAAHSGLTWPSHTAFCPASGAALVLPQPPPERASRRKQSWSPQRCCMP